MKNKQIIFRFIVCRFLTESSLASFTQSTPKNDWADWDFLYWRMDSG